MKLRYKVGGVLIGLLAAALLGLVYALSYEAECDPPPAPPPNAELMEAIIQSCYGPPDILRLERIRKPKVSANEVLVKVHAAAVNPADWHFLRGQPYLMRLVSGIGAPKNRRFGVDFSGTVEDIGQSVKKFRPGDEVFGGARGAFAEYVIVHEDRAVAKKPPEVSFEQAASVAIAGITALQALRDKGGVEPGDKVLINGASGGVGTFAVQIAKAFGAEVSGVCSTRNLQLVRSLGADHVIDYTRENFTEGEQRYDLIIDNVGNHPLTAVREVLEPDGTLVMVGGSSEGQWIEPFTRSLQALVWSPFVSQNLLNFLARLKGDDLEVLAQMMRSGKVTPVIDRRYALSQVPDAIRYSEEGHARAKIIIDVR